MGSIVQAEVAATRAAMTALRVCVDAAFASSEATSLARPDREAAGFRLRGFRKGRGLSQRALGQVIGCSQGYIADIESGRSQPSREFASKLYVAFGVGADWLLFGRGCA